MTTTRKWDGKDKTINHSYVLEGGYTLEIFTGKSGRGKVSQTIASVMKKDPETGNSSCMLFSNFTKKDFPSVVLTRATEKAVRLADMNAVPDEVVNKLILGLNKQIAEGVDPSSQNIPIEL